MREILFRGRLKNGLGWAEGNLNIRKNEIAIITPDETPIGRYGQVDPETIGQYTGLCDKNGTKIFEGDVIRRKGDFMASNYVIRYIDKYAAFIGMSYGNNEIYLHRCDADFVVIGNIHDNPELLEVKE